MGPEMIYILALFFGLIRLASNPDRGNTHGAMTNKERS